MTRLALLASLCLALAAAPSGATDVEPRVRIGDQAPAIEIEHWVANAPKTPERLEFGEAPVIFVIDFWATWCLPCIAGFPEMSELQERYVEDGVVILAVSDEERSVVEEFLDSISADGDPQRERMRFTVATDPDGSTHDVLLRRAGPYVIPMAFVIGRTGRIEWIGNPKEDDLARALERIVAGEWTEADRAQRRQEFEQWARSTDRFQFLLSQEQWDAAEKAAQGSWRQLNDIAWRIAFDPEGKVRDRDFSRAERLAREAIELSNEEEAFPFHVLAMLLARDGATSEVVELQRRAVSIEGDGKWSGYYQQTLARYEAALEDEE